MMPMREGSSPRSAASFLVVEVLSYRGYLKAVGVIAHIRTAREDYLHGLGREGVRDMPLYIRETLVVLGVGHGSIGPYADLLRARLLVPDAVHNLHLGSNLAHESHLPHELHASLQAIDSVALVGVEMQLGGDSHSPQLSVDEG